MKNIYFLFVFLFAITINPLAGEIYSPMEKEGLDMEQEDTSTANWPQIGFDAQRTGFNPNENEIGPSNVGNLEIQWTQSFGSTIRNGVSVVDGVAYYGLYGGQFMAVNATTGETLWTKSLNGKHQGQAVVDRVVYANSRYMVYAFKVSNGETLWTYDFASSDVRSTPVVANGVVYIETLGSLYALNATNGVKLWDVSEYGSVAIKDGIVYLSVSNTLYALNSENGEILWTGITEKGNLSRPAVSDGFVYVHSDEGYLYAFSVNQCNADTCLPLWAGVTQKSQEEGPQPPSIAYGNVYVGSSSKFYAFDSKGCGSSQCLPLWTTSTSCSFFPCHSAVLAP